MKQIYSKAFRCVAVIPEPGDNPDEVLKECHIVGALFHEVPGEPPLYVLIVDNEKGPQALVEKAAREAIARPQVSLDDQIKCVEREIALRINFYPKWIAKGRMKQDVADMEIKHMKAVRVSLEALRNWIKPEPTINERPTS